MEIKRLFQRDSALVVRLFREAGMETDGVNERFFQEDNILLVAKKDGEPAGFLYAHLLEMPHSTRPKLFLYSIDVFPQFQQQGIGTALIEELKRIGVSKNCSEIFVLTNENNTAANRLYQRTGGVRENPDDVMYVYPL